MSYCTSAQVPISRPWRGTLLSCTIFLPFGKFCLVTAWNMLGVIFPRTRARPITPPSFVILGLPSFCTPPSPLLFRTFLFFSLCIKSAVLEGRFFPPSFNFPVFGHRLSECPFGLHPRLSNAILANQENPVNCPFLNCHSVAVPSFSLTHSPL